MNITKNAFANALLATGYIGLIALFFNYANKIFGAEDTPLTPVAFLLLFVISAAVMAILVFGRPILWYLDGFKKEAVKLVFSTIGFLHDLFDVIAYSYEDKVSKPDKKSYELVVERLGVKPEECVFIDDHLPNIKAAEEMGITGIQFLNARQLEENLKRILPNVK